MSDYERNTVMGTARVFELTREILTERAGLELTEESEHGVTYTGGEGTVRIDAHRHGPYTTVTARTNQLRTSKVDTVVRHLLNQMPYQAADAEREY